jgi:hypothetical protein
MGFEKFIGCKFYRNIRIPTFALLSEWAGVVKLVDTLDLGSSAARRGGSSPSTRTIRGNEPKPTA